MCNVHQTVTYSTVEDLEARQMMSTVTLNHGILVIQGDANKSNNITVTLSKNKITATSGKAKLIAAVAQILALKITGGAKADIIDVSPLVRLGAYIDAGAGNDIVRTGAGADTVIAGAGNDTVTNRGGVDSVYGGAGINIVHALTHDAVYAGTGKSKVIGALNQSWSTPNPVIPLPPDAQKPVIVVVTTPPPSDDNTTQPPPVETNPPMTTTPPTTTTDTNPSTNTSTGTETDTNPPTNNQNPTNIQEPSGLGGTDSDQPPANPPPPAVVTYGPTLNARDFGAKLDGVTDDTAAIQAALDALPATGGTLVLDGVAAIGVKGIHLVGKDHITITSSSSGGFIAITLPSQQIGPASNSLFGLVNCTNLTINGLTIDGGAFNTLGIGLFNNSNSVVQNTNISNTGGYGALVSLGGTNNQFLNNYVHDTDGTGRGIWIGGTHAGELETNPLISGNVVTHTMATGIATIAHGARIINNRVTYSGGAGVVLGGVTLQTTQNAYVAGNYLCYNGYHGIQADNWSTPGAFVPIGSALIENNITDFNAHSGIYVVNAANWVVRNNECNNNSTGDGYNAGIDIGSSSHITVTGNTTSDTHSVGLKTQLAGIMLEMSLITAVSDITISNNFCNGNGVDGIMINNIGAVTMQGIAVTGNQCSNNQRYGIIFSETQPGTVTNLLYSGNIYSGNVQGSFANFLAMTIVS